MFRRCVWDRESISPDYSIFKPQTTIKPVFLSVYQSYVCSGREAMKIECPKIPTSIKTSTFINIPKFYRVQISVTRVQFQVRAMKMKGVPNFEKTSTFIQIFALTLFRNYEVSRMKRVSQLSSVNFENSSISKIHRALCLGWRKKFNFKVQSDEWWQSVLPSQPTYSSILRNLHQIWF